jgi:hypothetical protein
MFINRSIREIRIPKDWKENPGKYSVQIQKVEIQKIQIQKVNRIRSEWIPLENIWFEIVMKIRKDTLCIILHNGFQCRGWGFLSIHYL